MKATHCYECGVGLDLDLVPNYSKLHHRSGRFCPNCGAALDESSAKALATVTDFGPSTEAVRKNMVEKAAEFEKANA